MRAHRIRSFVLLGLYTVLADPAQAAEFASLAGRGSTLTLVGLVTLVLAALVFGLFHWIETARARRVNAAPALADGRQENDADNEPELATQRLAIVPANPMLDALSRKQGGAELEGSRVSTAVLGDGQADDQLAAAQ